MEKQYKGIIGMEVLLLMLAAITIVAINPAKNFEDARNAQRSSGVTAILNAISQYTSEEDNYLGTDQDGDMLPNCDDQAIEIGIGVGYYDLNEGDRFVPTYLVAMPFDPETGTEDATGYTICKSDTGRYLITAQDAEGGSVISVTR